METFLNLVIIGAFGLGLEVIFTSIAGLINPKRRNRVQAFGHASLWYLPIYGIILPTSFMIIQPFIETYSWFIRIPILALAMHIGEFVTMLILRKLNGASPSEENYLKSPRSIKGLVRWDYYPAFLCLAVVFEYLFNILFE